MKANIKQVCLWWKWDTYCDNCSEQIRDYSFSSAIKPEIGKPDYCTECLRKMIDSKDDSFNK